MSGFDDLNRLAADLVEVAVEVQRSAPRVLMDAARDLEADAKSSAAYATGELQRSIGTALDLVSLSAVVSAAADHGQFVEWGTSSMAPQPFMGPALDRVEPGFIAAIEALGGNIL